MASGVLDWGSRPSEKIPVPLPPLSEQRQLVGLLDDHLSRLEAATSSLRDAHERLRALERSALERLFGGRRDVQLADLVESISAGKSFGEAAAPAQPGEWGVIKVSAMTWGAFRPEQNKAVDAERVDPRFEIRGGDLLVSRANTEAYVGASVLVGPVRPRLLLSDKSLRIHPKTGVRSEWLWRALQAPSARRQISALSTGTKASMRNISQDALRQVWLPHEGPDAQEHALAEFAVQSDAIRRLRDGLTSTETQASHLRRALFSSAFRGELAAEAGSLAKVGH